jgi:hypothetical protein
MSFVGFILLEIVYLLLIAFTLRKFMLCTYSDPGVIPKIRSSKIDYNKSYHVQYTRENTSSFFSLDKFVSLQSQDDCNDVG